MSEQREIQLQQLANIVIDAYLDRDKQFKPEFGEYMGVMYLTRPKDKVDHPDLQVGFMYRKADYDSEGR